MSRRMFFLSSFSCAERAYLILNILYNNVRCKRARQRAHTHAHSIRWVPHKSQTERGKGTWKEPTAPRPPPPHSNNTLQYCKSMKNNRQSTTIIIHITFLVGNFKFVCTFTLTLGRRSTRTHLYWTIVLSGLFSLHRSWQISPICHRIAPGRRDATRWHSISFLIIFIHAVRHATSVPVLSFFGWLCDVLIYDLVILIWRFFLLRVRVPYCVYVLCAVDCNTTYTHIYHIRINLRIKYIRVHLKSTMLNTHWMCRYLFWHWSREQWERGGEKSEADGNLHYFHDSMQLILVHKFIIARNVSATHISAVCKIVKSLCIVWLLINTAYQFVIFFEW